MAVIETPTDDDIMRETISDAKDFYAPTVINRTGRSIQEQIEEDEARLDKISNKYGTAEAAVTKAGGLIAAKGEQHAGITAIQVQQAWEQRQAAAQAKVDECLAKLQPYTDATTASQEAYNKVPEEMRKAGEPSQAVGAERDRLRKEYLAAHGQMIEQRALLGFNTASAELQLITYARDPQSKADLRRLADGYQKALSEVREMGGETLALNPKSTKGAKEVFNQAAQVFPRNWIEASNARSAPIAKIQKARAHYIDSKMHETKKKVQRSYLTTMEPGETPKDSLYYTFEKVGSEFGDNVWRRSSWESAGSYANPDVKPRGNGWQQYQDEDGRRYWRRPSTRLELVSAEAAPEIRTENREVLMDGMGSAERISQHELSHRMEYSVPGIMAMEQDFLERRTTTNGVRDKLEPLGRGMKGERARPDSFTNAYMGKEYSHSGAREVLSCGVEALFGGSYGGLVGIGRNKPDHDMRAFILGVMATAERPTN